MITQAVGQRPVVNHFQCETLCTLFLKMNPLPYKLLYKNQRKSIDAKT